MSKEKIGVVPDGYMPIPTVEQLSEALENVRSFHDMSAELIAPELLANLLAAQTVKAEQVRYSVEDLQQEALNAGLQYVREPDDHYVTGTTEQALDFIRNMIGVDVRLSDATPSLPAAGFADVGKFSVQCSVCKESSTLDDRKGLSGCCWSCGHEIDLDSHLRAALSAQQSAPERVSVPVEFRKVADKILSKLIRFADCAEDFEAGGVDIGRDWLDTLTHLGLLERIQRSPALWQTTDEADAIIDAQRALLASHGRGEA